MSDVPEPKDALMDELSDQADIQDLVGGGDIVEKLDFNSLGRTMGKSFGALVGRQLGRQLARRVRSKLPFTSSEDRDESLVGRVLGALVVAVVRTFSRPPYRDAVSEMFEGVAERWETASETAEEATEAAESAADDATEAAEATTDTAEEATEAAAGTAEEAAESAAETGSDAVEALPGDLDDVKRDTYRELLEVLSYSDLQSVAKSVGVKANLGREEMTDAIVEEFSEEEEEGEPDEGDTGDEDTGEGDEE